MKYLFLPFVLAAAFTTYSFGQKVPKGAAESRMTEAELLGYPAGTKTVIERMKWIFRTGPGDQTTEEPGDEITVSDFRESGQLYLIRRYGTERMEPYRMEHHIRIGDRVGIVFEPLKELAVVNEKTIPTVAPYRIPKGTNISTMGVSRYTYDRLGRILEVKRSKADGKWIDTASYKYDDQGRVIEHVLRSIFEDDPLITTYKYDARGQLAEDIYSNSKATFTTTYSGYKLDSRGNWVERATITISKSKPGEMNGADSIPREARWYRTVIYYQR